MVLVDLLDLLHFGLGFQLRETVVVYEEDFADHVALLGYVVFYVLVFAYFFVVFKFVDVIILLRKSVGVSRDWGWNYVG